MFASHDRRSNAGAASGIGCGDRNSSSHFHSRERKGRGDPYQVHGRCAMYAITQLVATNDIEPIGTGRSQMLRPLPACVTHTNAAVQVNATVGVVHDIRDCQLGGEYSFCSAATSMRTCEHCRSVMATMILLIVGRPCSNYRLSPPGLPRTRSLMLFIDQRTRSYRAQSSSRHASRPPHDWSAGFPRSIAPAPCAAFMFQIGRCSCWTLSMACAAPS